MQSNSVPSSSPPYPVVKLGRIAGVYGIKGWVKVVSDTEPADNIFLYQPWLVNARQAWHTIKLIQHKSHGKGFIAKLDGCDNRTQAEGYVRADIAVNQALMPPLDKGEYYWSQLLGMQVMTAQEVNLGQVVNMLATGANDVMVVQAPNSEDEQNKASQKERLIPWLPEQVIIKVDQDANLITVDWDPDF